MAEMADLATAGPTMDVTDAATVLGVSRGTLYAAIKDGTAPVRWIQVRGRIKVITASVRELLGDDEAVRSGETASGSPRSEAGPYPRTGPGVKRAAGGQPDAGAA